MSAESLSADLGDVRVSPSENDKNPAHFTPGPWSQNYIGTHGFIVRGGDRSVHVASVLPKQDFVDSAEAKANANLIAAAPDLAAAAIRLVNELTGMLGAYDMALRTAMGNTNVACLQVALDEGRAALAKARGER